MNLEGIAFTWEFMVDMYFVMDIILNFMTAFEDEDRRLVHVFVCCGVPTHFY